MNRRFKIVLVFVLLLVPGLVVGPAIYLSGGGGYRRAVEAYKRDLIAKGEKLAMAELAPPATNDSVRAKEFMDLMSTPVPTNLPSAMKMIAPGVAARATSIVTPDQMAGYEQNVGRVAKLGEILGNTRLGFNVDYSAAPNLPMPHLAKVKAAESLARGTFIQALATNDAAQARSDLLVAVDLVRLFDENHTMISDLLRISMANNAASATWEALQSGRWNEPQLAELQAKWQGMDLFERSGLVLRMTRAENVTYLAVFRKSQDFGDPTAVGFGPASTGNSDAGWSFDELRDKAKDLYDRYPRYWKWRATWSYEEELSLLQMAEADLRFVSKARATGAFASSLPALDREIADILLAHPGATNHFMWFGPDNELAGEYLSRSADAETFRRLTVAAIALKRYQLAHNAYPASLSDLVPQYFARVPLDFMDGKPLRYKLKPDGNFLLYSVGEDGEDNGGNPTPTSGTSWLRGRDFVWPRAATAKEIEEYQKTQKEKAAGGNSN